jgi:hypothetical protein
MLVCLLITPIVTSDHRQQCLDADLHLCFFPHAHKARSSRLRKSTKNDHLCCASKFVTAYFYTLSLALASFTITYSASHAHARAAAVTLNLL